MSILYVCPNCEESKEILSIFSESKRALKNAQAAGLAKIAIDSKGDSPYLRTRSGIIASGIDEIWDALFPPEQPLPPLEVPSRFGKPKQKTEQENDDMLEEFRPPPRKPKNESTETRTAEAPPERGEIRKLNKFDLESLLADD